ncbi:MAG: hypothetical protein LBU27_00580 [Candidatus Peribacteria bacterium]|jgi:hypothetical protein|nr:hypothetical protein [Candidatus Peribacteria bacterium]
MIEQKNEKIFYYGQGVWMFDDMAFETFGTALAHFLGEHRDLEVAAMTSSCNDFDWSYIVVFK